MSKTAKTPAAGKRSKVSTKADTPPADAGTGKKQPQLFDQIIYKDWCKACGICIAFCPKKVFERSHTGKPVVAHADQCNGCLFCELHCPDFAITIQQRQPFQRRSTDVKPEKK